MNTESEWDKKEDGMNQEDRKARVQVRVPASHSQLQARGVCHGIKDIVCELIIDNGFKYVPQCLNGRLSGHGGMI